jgi:hypothetical protein
MGGYQQLVRGEPFRGKFRNGFDKPAPFEPGQRATIAFTMPDVCHTFRKGHRALFWFGFIFPVLWFAGAVMRPVPGAAR